MAARARGLGLLRGGLAGLPALGRRAALGEARHVFRGFRSSGVRHEAIIISGTEMAKQIQKEIQRGVESWISLGNRRPHLSIILVGDNPASHMYVRNKIRAACTVGICSELILKPKSVSQEELLDITDQLNMDPRVSGILVQLPLPDHVDERTVCNGITPEKDVDGFHIINIGRLCLDQHSLIPATASAVWEIIKRTGIETFGKNVVVAGRSKNVGMPIAMLLHTDGDHERPGGDATVTIAHRYTPKEQLKIHTQLADIIIVAADFLTFRSYIFNTKALDSLVLKPGSEKPKEHLASCRAPAIPPALFNYSFMSDSSCETKKSFSLSAPQNSSSVNEDNGGCMKIPSWSSNCHSQKVSRELGSHLHWNLLLNAFSGIPKLITSDMVKERAAVIDVGINYVQDPVTGKTRLVGDVDFEAVRKKASFITPVPGGVGPMTVAMLLKNTLLAAKKIIY
ncbi:bifunctional methylenetetrahydrofolate dehydrogenase/cyclohydrolase 2, mitochondrial isoform X3 [Elephas maximus indicus]|uniref:bifunctional methylenetetrahydrofolate dehydrogenase/cyclohydrolase 2, mitochondrial isoform X3 n=1 Tax=Elephas maximus indicus TaxID=99487 RepID=UPI002117091F|nr:bifunctional methylenetetrahydrofolate dehydrogenase/cyclohydrolase 2, mitochondrial isoform X3 [Elephas maximus indicus]